MNNFLIKTTTLLLFFYNINSFAQNDVKLSIFNFNQIAFNPAYTGASEGLNVTGIYTTQWVGYEGAPKTGLFSIQNKFHDINSGFGLSIFNDKAGPVNLFNIDANYAYFLNLNKNWKASFGIKAGLKNNTIDFNILNRLHPQESYIGYDKASDVYPIIGTGINFYNDNFFIGFSTPNILKTKYTNSNFTSVIGNDKNYFYATAGYKFENKYNFVFTPSLLARYTEGAPISLLTSFNAKWNEKVIGGINFEYNSTLGGYLGINALKNTKIGYAYDFSINNFISSNGGNHTIFLIFDLKNDYDEKCSCSFL